MLAILVNIALSPRSVSVTVGRQIEACRIKFERTPRDSGSNTRIFAQIVDQSTNASIFCLVPTSTAALVCRNPCTNVKFEM
jgi:hypothetical protein